MARYVKLIASISLIGLYLTLSSCKKEETPALIDGTSEWQRDAQNPVFRDFIPSENYQIASDAHVFYDDNGALKMVYSGDVNGFSSIKLASGSSVNSWNAQTSLLFETGPSGLDINKETAFYRKSADQKHQIYYIGYTDETTYEAQIYLAEADALEGPYTQSAEPVVAKGSIAGNDVYCMTSPSVVEHQGVLYMIFIGWNDTPNNTTVIWILGATSTDEGRTWSDFQEVDTRIGAEGQVTKVSENEFTAVRTTDYENGEAIFYATASNPFGPWTEEPDPILIQAGAPFEKDEIIAAQILIDNSSDKEYLFYTGADYDIGWWIMLAERR